jgi:hypothetical membrane protein
MGRMTQGAVASASAALLVPVVAWLIGQHLQPPGYDPYRQTISALAAHGATDRWVMTAGLFLLGMAHLTTAALLPAIGLAGRSVLAFGGATTLAVAALPQPNPWHLVVAGLAFAAFTTWPALARAPGPSHRVAATAVLSGLLLWFGLQLGGGALLGFSERILVAAEAGWPLVVAIGLTKRARISR